MHDKIHKKVASISQNRLKNKKYLCMYPGCNEYCIKSHSIQKKLVLKNISKNGEVYGLNADTTNYESYSQNEATFRLIGISDASTFNGYCSKHDHDIFEPIENNKYELTNQYHNLLLYLRSLSCLYARKRQAADLFSINAEEYRKAEMRESEKRYIKHAKLHSSVAKNMKKNVDRIFKDIDNRKYSNYGFCTLRLEGSFSLSCVTLIDIPMLLGVRKMFTTWNHFSFSFLPSNDYAYVAFVWRKGFDNLMYRFINHSKDNTGFMMNALLFHYNEDTLFNPDDWNRLSDKNKKYLKFFFVHPSFRTTQEIIDILQYFKH